MNSTNRLIVRRQWDATTAGFYHQTLKAPDGYRVVSGFMSAADNSNYTNIEFMGNFPVSSSDSNPVEGGADVNGIYDSWRFQVKTSGTANLYIGLICERSEEPDVFLYKSVSTLFDE